MRIVALATVVNSRLLDWKKFARNHSMQNSKLSRKVSLRVRPGSAEGGGRSSLLEERAVERSERGLGDRASRWLGARKAAVSSLARRAS
jgi:hypothetical protein